MRFLFKNSEFCERYDRGVDLSIYVLLKLFNLENTRVELKFFIGIILYYDYLKFMIYLIY